MRAAPGPRPRRDDSRLMVVDCDKCRVADVGFELLPKLLRPGDVVVVNDAATLPASIPAATSSGDNIELRIVSINRNEVRVAVLGAGDWRQRTEDRPAPPTIAVGEQLTLPDGATATVLGHSTISTRLIDIRVQGEHGATAVAYHSGVPVQYSHLSAPLDLWSVQTAYAARPWAVEMPSAGRPLSWKVLTALKKRGIEIAGLTHAAGLSATGDAAIDRALPLPERFEIPPETVQAIERASQNGGRVIAIGTTVVRALEGSAHQNGGQLVAGGGVTDLIIGPELEPRIVDGLLSGMHDPTESHYRLLQAFASRFALETSWQLAMQLCYQSHEFGDSSLLLPDVELDADLKWTSCVESRRTHTRRVLRPAHGARAVTLSGTCSAFS